MRESVLVERWGWDRLSRGLIGYGLLMLAVGLLWVGALTWLNGRVTGLREEVRLTVPRLTSAADLTAAALKDAATTAGSFRTTLDQSAEALSSSASTITVVRSDLSAFEGQLRSVSILGARPLASPADAVGRIVASMDGLDTKLSLIADGLRGSRETLAATATSLRGLGDSADLLAGELALADVQRALDDAQLILVLALVLCAVSALVPALGALWLGLSLRRWLRRSRPA